MSNLSQSRPGGSNGCLLAVLGIGIVLVVLGVAIEVLPERPTSPFDDRAPAVVELPQPAQPDPYYEPPTGNDSVVDPLEDLIPEPMPLEDAAPGIPIFWLAEWPGDPATPCVLAMETTSNHRMNRLKLACADGRLLDGDITPVLPEGQRLGTNSSAIYRTRFTGQASDADRVSFTIEVDTDNHQLDVTQDDVGLYTQLYIEDLSVPVPGHGAALAQTQVSQRTVRLAVPTLVTGRIPGSVALTRGTGRNPRANDPVCELSAGPVFGEFNCRVTLRCNGEIIYGAGTSGYNDCALRGGAIVSARDDGTTEENGDPRIELDFDSGTVTVSDVDEGSAWSATFDLITDPRCEVSRFQGSLTTGQDDVRWQAWQLENGTPPSMTWTNGEVSSLDALTVFCPDGYAFGRRNDGAADLTFGAGFRSLAGYASPDGELPRGIYAFRR